MIVQLDQAYQTSAVINCLDKYQILPLNLAAPKKSKIPGIYEQARKFIGQILQEVGYVER